MFGSFKRAWVWFVDGLGEALLGGLDRVTRRPAYRVEISDGNAVVRGPDGGEIGRVIETDNLARFEPPDLIRRLTNASIDLRIPASWLFQRRLDPVAAQSIPYLDAFVRHQIDRITPWRVADVHYGIVHAPIAGDPTRLSVEVGVVPKRLVRTSLDLLRQLKPKHTRLVAAKDQGNAVDFAIPLGESARPRTAGMRRPVAIALVAILLGFAGAMSWAWWEAGIVRAEIDDEDQLISQRKAVLAAEARRDQAGRGAEEALRALRASRPRAVDLIEALSAALPDSAYLTKLTVQKDQLRISGISTSTPQLVPALETSGRFADVAFSAATTRLESGAGDRFHLEMRATGPSPEALPK